MATSSDPSDITHLKRLAGSGSPALADALGEYLQQPDPTPTSSAREGTLSFDAFLRLLTAAQGARSPQQRRERATEAWARYLAQLDPPPPPRFELADLLVQIYEAGTDAGRKAICDAARSAPLMFGAWGGFKRIYKLAEARLDAQVFGALAHRLDVEIAAGGRREVSRGTLIYMRRRAWRFLRTLGRSTPELYPQFAVEVLRHYDPGVRFGELWVANHIWAHQGRKYDGRSFHGGMPPGDMVKHRAFPDAWKRSPDALMLLLETCGADPAAKFAIQGLRKDFPEELRRVTPAWLARLAHRPLASAHEFLVETLLGSPDFHQGKLRALGLHDAVLALLVSPSAQARAYAVEYARAHAQDMDLEHLAGLLASSYRETRAFAAAAVQARSPRDLGYAFLGRLLAFGDVEPWARKALQESFDRAELPEPFLIDMLYGGAGAQKSWASGYIKAKYPPAEIGAGFWVRVLDDRRQPDDRGATRAALEALGKYPVAEIGTAWLLDALTRDGIGQTVAGWLRRAESLPGLDVERLKGLVFAAQTRAVAFEVLGNPKIVAPRQIGLPWLLALARRVDPSLHEFARRYLLEHMKPADFDVGRGGAGGAGDAEAGIARLFSLALGEKEPEPMRAFAQTYLRCHHPSIGPEQPEAKAIELKQALRRAAFTAARIWPALADRREDVRRFAVLVTRVELRAWGYHTRVYELCESDAREVRNIAFEALRKAGEPSADPAMTLSVEELDPAQVFGLTESLKKSAREVGLELILKHYARLGGAARLGWLMQSADREVRLFAVRILWEKHRPRALPPGWRPRGGKKGAQADAKPPFDDAGRFADVEALRGFIRQVMLGLPPGRAGEPADDGGSRRRVPASVAKRHVIEVVRDLAVEDAAFARLVAPVLSELTGAIAKGEWQACLSALMHLRRAHPGVFDAAVASGGGAGVDRGRVDAGGAGGGIVG